MTIRFHKRFVKLYRKLPAKLQKMVDRQLILFSRTPFSHELRNHALAGKYTGYRSIDITGDYRAIYKEISSAEAIFVMIGTHAKLYG